MTKKEVARCEKAVFYLEEAIKYSLLDDSVRCMRRSRGYIQATLRAICIRRKGHGRRKA